MQDDLKNILSGAEGNISGDQLLKYLKNELGPAESHELEKQAADEGFESDALEGLQQVTHSEKIELIVDGLNRELKKRTAKKIHARQKRQLKPQWWLYFSILILLILVVLIYILLHHNIGAKT
ncbi:hypothetical protein [Niabella aquatica]